MEIMAGNLEASAVKIEIRQQAGNGVYWIRNHTTGPNQRRIDVLCPFDAQNYDR